MRTPKKLAAAALTALALSAGTATAASALTVVPAVPAPGTGMDHDGFFWNDGNDYADRVVSPFPTVGHLRTRDNVRSVDSVWQQRPDGQWTPLTYVWGWYVYPVWEDPAALGIHRDQIRNATPEPIRTFIPQQVWDLIPR